ncbi:hypothetical protein ACEPAI_4657 [Sanghuangporus weigelae]
MNGTVETEVSADFKVRAFIARQFIRLIVFEMSEYDQILETLASSDYVLQDWNKLCDMIKYKLKENIASYMSDPPPPPPPPPPEPMVVAPELPSASPQSASTVATLSPGVLPATGAKFPPFPKREENQFIRNEFNSFGRAKAVLKEEEAKEMYEGICKLLYEFEGSPPFSIQRLCELAIRPRQHFKYAGKYLRAVERALLVTSTIDAFPVVSADENDASSSPFMSIGSLREATTPLFSPIPFLHEDARRSRSRSPPMSPLNLSTNAATRPLSPSADPLSLGTAAAEGATGGMGVDTPAIGLVDELDDPSPGHLSDHPTALTSTMTTTTATANSNTQTESTTGGPSGIQTSTAATGTAPAGKPMFGGSLQDRFVKSKSSSSTAEAEMEEVPSASTSVSASSGDQLPSSGAAAESESASSAGGATDALPAEAVNNDSNNNMAVDETEADKENVPKS